MRELLWCVLVVGVVVTTAVAASSGASETSPELAQWFGEEDTFRLVRPEGSLRPPRTSNRIAHIMFGGQPLRLCGSDCRRKRDAAHGLWHIGESVGARYAETKEIGEQPNAEINVFGKERLDFVELKPEQTMADSISSDFRRVFIEDNLPVNSEMILKKRDVGIDTEPDILEIKFLKTRDIPLGNMDSLSFVNAVQHLPRKSSLIELPDSSSKQIRELTKIHETPSQKVDHALVHDKSDDSDDPGKEETYSYYITPSEEKDPAKEISNDDDMNTVLPEISKGGEYTVPPEIFNAEGNTEPPEKFNAYTIPSDSSEGDDRVPLDSSKEEGDTMPPDGSKEERNTVPPDGSKEERDTVPPDGSKEEGDTVPPQLFKEGGGTELPEMSREDTSSEEEALGEVLEGEFVLAGGGTSEAAATRSVRDTGVAGHWGDVGGAGDTLTAQGRTARWRLEMPLCALGVVLAALLVAAMPMMHRAVVTLLSPRARAAGRSAADGDEDDNGAGARDDEMLMPPQTLANELKAYTQKLVQPSLWRRAVEAPAAAAAPAPAPASAPAPAPSPAPAPAVGVVNTRMVLSRMRAALRAATRPRAPAPAPASAPGPAPDSFPAFLDIGGGVCV